MIHSPTINLFWSRESKTEKEPQPCRPSGSACVLHGQREWRVVSRTFSPIDVSGSAMKRSIYSHSYSDSLFLWKKEREHTSTTLLPCTLELTFLDFSSFRCQISVSKGLETFVLGYTIQVSSPSCWQKTERRNSVWSKWFTVLDGCRPRLTFWWQRNIQVNYSTWSTMECNPQILFWSVPWWWKWISLICRFVVSNVFVVKLG